MLYDPKRILSKAAYTIEPPSSIEGHGISTGSVAAQPIIAQEAGTTMDLVGATVISRLKVVVTDTT